MKERERERERKEDKSEGMGDISVPKPIYVIVVHLTCWLSSQCQPLLFRQLAVPALCIMHGMLLVPCPASAGIHFPDEFNLPIMSQLIEDNGTLASILQS